MIGTDTQRDFELACVREFSHSGLHLGGDVSRQERRERIRAAIFREGKQNDCWRNTPLSYAAAYRQAYHLPLEAREGDIVKASPTLLWDNASGLETDLGVEVVDETQEEAQHLTI